MLKLNPTPTTSASNLAVLMAGDTGALQRLMHETSSMNVTPATGTAALGVRIVLVTDQWLTLADAADGRIGGHTTGFARLLEREGFACLLVGPEAAQLDRSAAYEPDLVLVRMTAAIDERIAVLYRVRERLSCPVVMLDSGQHGSDALLTDELIALEAGFDDVWRETGTDRLLIARMRAQLRRSARPGAGAPRSARLVVGGLSIDRDGAIVKYCGRPLALTPAQLDALFVLASHQGRVVSRDQIEAACVGLRRHAQRDGEPQRRAVDALVSRLRSRLAAAGVASIEIGSVQGRGYRLAVQAVPPLTAANVAAARAAKTQALRPRRAAEVVD
jgi:two-component system response regulator RstA